jgi:hypothetical protein
VEKAEFLVKLQVPVAYLYKDPTKKKEGALLLIQEHSRDPTLKVDGGVPVDQ